MILFSISLYWEPNDQSLELSFLHSMKKYCKIKSNEYNLATQTITQRQEIPFGTKDCTKRACFI